MKISSEEKKEMILQNFVSLLQQYGIEKVTLNDVAEKSGLTKSALYYYFDSKESLMIASFKKYRSLMTAKLNSMLKKAEEPKEMMGIYCDFLFDLPKDKDFSRLLSFSHTVIEEIAKYVISVPTVTNEIINSKLEDFDKMTAIVAGYAGEDKNDPKMKKITLLFQLLCEEALRLMFKLNRDSESGSSSKEMSRIEKDFSEILKTVTKDEFTAFIKGGLDNLIKTTFKDKN